MLVDIHTNLGWYPDHYSDEFVEFALAAKKAKMRITPDVYFAGEEEEEKNAFDSTPETLLEATKDCDKVVVFGLKAPFCGINIPQEMVADFVNQHSDRFIGWCSVDPNDEDCVDQLVYNVEELGLRGLKYLPKLRSGGYETSAAFQKSRSVGHPGDLASGHLLCSPRTVKILQPNFFGGHRSRLPESSHDYRAHGASLGNRLRGPDSQAPESVRRHLRTSLSSIAALLRVHGSA